VSPSTTELDTLSYYICYRVFVQATNYHKSRTLLFRNSWHKLTSTAILSLSTSLFCR
jgi:hypothetical protein